MYLLPDAVMLQVHTGTWRRNSSEVQLSPPLTCMLLEGPYCTFCQVNIRSCAQYGMQHTLAEAVGTGLTRAHGGDVSVTAE